MIQCYIQTLEFGAEEFGALPTGVPLLLLLVVAFDEEIGMVFDVTGIGGVVVMVVIDESFGNSESNSTSLAAAAVDSCI
jgi:hypothetical protein